jgi:hypothetical protein
MILMSLEKRWGEALVVGETGFDLLRPRMSRPALRDIELRHDVPRERDRVSGEGSASEVKYMGTTEP